MHRSTVTLIIIIIIQPSLTASNLPTESQRNNLSPPHSRVENSIGRRPTFDFVRNLSFLNWRETEKKYHGPTFSASRNFGKRKRERRKEKKRKTRSIFSPPMYIYIHYDAYKYISLVFYVSVIFKISRFSLSTVTRPPVARVKRGRHALRGGDKKTRKEERKKSDAGRFTRARNEVKKLTIDGGKGGW